MRISDASQTPPFRSTATVDVRVSDLGGSERTARYAVQVHAPDLLEALTVEGRVGSRTDWASSQLKVHMAGLHVGRLASYLKPLGVAPVAEALDLDLAADVYAHAGPEPLRSARPSPASRCVPMAGKRPRSTGSS